MKWQKLQRIVFIFFLIIAIGSILACEIFGVNFDLEQIRQYLKDFNVWAPLIFIIFYTLGTFFLPVTPFIIVGGILFGIKFGLIYTIIGSFLSSIIVFFIARKSGKDWVEKILEYKYFKRLGKYNERLERGAIWDLIILRIVPVMPFNILNILMGVSKIKTRDYVTGTVLGLIPSHILTVFLGTLIGKIL